jgi:hypothetical protein
MEQRRLRLGDILDDYCPRERRVTNHAVVAMIEEDVKQTRCTTCDAEHPYKGARVPKRRKKETPAALYNEVLAGMPELDADAPSAPVRVAAVHLAPPADVITAINVSPPSDFRSRHEPAEDRQSPMHNNNNGDRPSTENEIPTAQTSEPADAAPRIDEAPVDGPVHRPLIRATLPRPEGQKDVRQAPEFTVRHAPPRGTGHGYGQNNFRGERMRVPGGNGTGHGSPNGKSAHGSGSRFHGGSGGRPAGPGRPSSGRGGAPSGFRSGNNGPNGKRGRGPRG